MSYITPMTKPNRPQSVADFFKFMRTDRGITQDQLAELASCSRMYIGHIEQGKYKMPLESIKALKPVMTKKEKDLIREILVAELLEDLGL